MYKRKTDLNLAGEKDPHISWNPFNYIGKAIVKADAGLSRIRVFGRYDPAEISRALGELENDETFVPENRVSNYDTKIIRNINGVPDLYLTVVVNHKRPFAPQSSLEIHFDKDKSMKYLKSFLVWLNEKLPNLSISKVEYFVDQFCMNHNGATVLFWIASRCLHLSYRKKGRLVGE